VSFSRSHMKRKVDLEWRAFKVQWGINYFVVKMNDKVICLLCNDTIAIWKGYNIRRHYQTKHETEYSKLTQDQRIKKLEILKQNDLTQRNLFSKIKNKNEAVTKLSLQLAHLLAIKEKLFTDSDLIKSCLLVAADEICPEINC